jgi:hypothetical protein
LNSKNIFTAELRKILTYKEELLTNVKNMLYRRPDDIERLQKVITDTEQQFAECLQQIKTLGEEKEQRQKELEDLKGAAQKLMARSRFKKVAKQTSGLCWSDFLERHKRSSVSSLNPPSLVSAMLLAL